MVSEGEGTSSDGGDRIDSTDSAHDDGGVRLVNHRKYLRQRVTYIKNKTKNGIDHLTVREIKSYRSDLLSYKAELRDLDMRIFSLCLVEGQNQESLDEQTAKEQEYDSVISECLSRLQSQVSSDNADSDRRSAGSQKIKLPEIKLPVFGNYDNENLEKFLYEFESILSGSNLSPYEQFVYLKNQLRGSPRTLIDALNVTERNYIAAKSLLIKAFASSLVQKYNAIRMLSELSLGDDPYAYVGQIKTITSTFEHLDIDVATIIQFFVWNGFSEEFQTHFIQTVNNNTPSLKEINNNIFSVIDRYNRQGRKIKKSQKSENKNISVSKPRDFVNCDANSSPTKVHAYATNVKGVRNGYKLCILCEYDQKPNDHYMKDCSFYNTAARRTDKLTSIGACTKCSFKNHETSKCRFIFKSKCKICGGDHFTYLCMRDSKSKATSDSFEKVVNKTSSVKISRCSSDSDARMLPTLTCKLKDTNSRLYRLFKDGGCQRNFILTKIADSLNLHVVKYNVNVEIEGAIATENRSTKIVLVPLVYNGKVSNIEAICVPKIKLKLVNMKGLHSVVNSFVEKGYTMADKLICSGEGPEMVDDISVVLGTDSDHLFELRYETFGSVYPQASYISSELGVVLSGNIGRMMRNIDELPICTVDSQHNDSSVVSKFCQTERIQRFPNDNDDFSRFDESCITVYNNKCLTVLDDSGELLESQLDMAKIDAVKSQSRNYITYDSVLSEVETETNLRLVNYVLDNTVHLDSGHIEMPLPWNHKIVHRLGHNFNLSKKILQSNLRKLQKCPEKLQMYDDVFREQLDLGIIEKIDDVEEFVKLYPHSSFMPHMAVWNLNKSTSKCRPVFLSNLCETNSVNPHAVSHNQAMLPGPVLNQKISTSLLNLRFDTYLITFDVKRAFQNISLNEFDQNRLAFLWYRNVSKGDFTIVGFKNLRLSFGLRSSPCVLMLCLFKMLMLDTHNDNDEIRNLKRALYAAMYMDNGGYTTNDENKLLWAYNNIPKLFEQYKFFLQQYETNSEKLKDRIANDAEEQPVDDYVKLLGMLWNKSNDSLCPPKIKLDITAGTKRSILSSVNSVYDVFNIYIPILNRARLFLQRLLSDSSLDWDSRLSEGLCREWRNIAKQANKTPTISIQRCIGRRSSRYSLIAFTDASKQIYGVVVYVKDLLTNNISYLSSRNRVVTSDMKAKTIPVLEFSAICLGVETLQDLYLELTGESTVLPVDIESLHLFTDSMVSLQWIRGYVVDYAKMQKKSVFVMNRLRILVDICQNCPITFDHINGERNPADYVSRETSYRQLMNTDFYAGPGFLKGDFTDIHSEVSVIVPNPLAASCQEIPSGDDKVLCHSVGVEESAEMHHVISLDRYSSIYKLIRVLAAVLKFIHLLKLRVKRGSIEPFIDYNCQAFTNIVETEQRIHCPDLFRYFDGNPKNLRDIPQIVNQLNLIKEDSIIKVKSKFPRSERGYPVFLPKKSMLTELIIRDCHEKMSHIGTYTILRELRPHYYITHCYSTVRKIIRNCVCCRKLNAKCIELNQNSYRDFRLNPKEIPFANVFIDYAGPWTIQKGNRREKIWLLLITCCWSRAVNIKVCESLDVPRFLRAIQLHIFEYGLFSFCSSDLGSQICAGSRVISGFLDDMETVNYFQTHGIQRLKFCNFPKGNSSLGSLIESCVKQVKLLMNKSINKTVLSYADFEFIVAKVVHLVNRRPIAFKDSLRSLPDGEVPTAITPEMLVKGRELVSVNVIPCLQPIDRSDPDWSAGEPTEVIRGASNKLEAVRTNLITLYHSEFLATLTEQAVSKKDRYKRVNHQCLDIGDIVLLEEKLLKQSSYPMGVVVGVDTNSLGEVTAARVKKGLTREIVYRHASSLILLLKRESTNVDVVEENSIQVNDELPIAKPVNKRRKAALISERKIKSLIDDNLV